MVDTGPARLFSKLTYWRPIKTREIFTLPIPHPREPMYRHGEVSFASYKRKLKFASLTRY